MFVLNDTGGPGLQSDEEVVSAVLAGDREAFEVLVIRYGNRLYQHARWMTGSRDAAEDIVQASFLKAYLGLKDIRGHCGAWLLRIVVNGCREWATAGRRQVEGRVDDGSGSVIGTAPEGWSPRFGGPEEEFDRAELRGALEKALATLTPDFREAFVMHHIHGLPYDVMAAVLGSSAGTLRMRALRAREQLRRLLTPMYQGQV